LRPTKKAATKLARTFVPAFWQMDKIEAISKKMHGSIA
jgi:hypothetical protein